MPRPIGHFPSVLNPKATGRLLLQQSLQLLGTCPAQRTLLPCAMHLASEPPACSNKMPCWTAQGHGSQGDCEYICHVCYHVCQQASNVNATLRPRSSTADHNITRLEGYKLVHSFVAAMIDGAKASSVQPCIT